MDNEILIAALEYAKNGYAVFPVMRNKRPYTPHGCKDAKTDPRAIKAWWKRWPDANIGIATGSISNNLIVVDLDVDDNKGINGYHELEAWEKDNGTFPDTWTAITGRGGYHFYFRHPNAANITNRAGVLEGVDIRGEGGYVVAPPSVHQNGTLYEWEYPPDEYEIASPVELLDKLLSVGKKQDRHDTQFVAPEIIEDGQRNQTLFKMAASLQEKGLTDEAILEAIWQQNLTSCANPLDRTEVEVIAKSATRYKKGEMKELAKNGFEKWRPPQFATYTDNNGNEKLKQTIENMAEAIQWDKELWGRIRYNSLAYAPYVYSNLPWSSDNGRKFREWTNNDDSNLKSYIEAKYGFKSLDKIMEALKIVAYRHKYNPVCDLLESCLERYDGKKHIENLLPDYLGAEKNEYTATVLKLVMLGAICRAYFPGCKFDYTAVWAGGQGIGKSTFTRYLALNDDWFNDNFNSIDGDKAAEKLRGMWIVELAELLATKKAKEVESIKAFLTSTADNYRPPYERRTEQRKRSCIFIGTTNSMHFLTDRTGNRRFLPVMCDGDKVKKDLFGDEQEVRMEFVQAWGEAMKIFMDANKKPSLILPRHLQIIANEMQSRFMEEDSRVGVIQEWLDEVGRISKYDRVCVKMIAFEALHIEILDKRTTNELHEIMETSISGWERLVNDHDGRARCGRYGPQICYVQPWRNHIAAEIEQDSDEENMFD